MLKIKRGSVEILGCIGFITWLSVVLFRMSGGSINEAGTFVVGVLPNMGAAWFVTLLCKLVLIFVFKKDLTVRKHFLICIGIWGIALFSEMVYRVFFHRSFDVWDIVVTTVAQIIIFLTPILTKDQYFSNYNQK